jgi:hypothetical protein
VIRVVDRLRNIERWVVAKSSAVRDPDGKVALAINFSQDITALREREEAPRFLQKPFRVGDLAEAVGSPAVAESRG